MKVLFIEYPKCSTCRKAKKWLEENNINFTDRHIVDQKPTKEELFTTAKITAAVAVATAVVSLAVQAVLRNR